MPRPILGLRLAEKLLKAIRKRKHAVKKDTADSPSAEATTDLAAQPKTTDCPVSGATTATPAAQPEATTSPATSATTDA